MNRFVLTIAAVWVVAALVPSLHADPYDGVEARLRMDATTVVPGKPVIVDFLLRNTTDKPVVLTPPGVEIEQVSGLTGLPLDHVFSGTGFTALSIRGDYGRTWTEAFGYQPAASAREIVLGPYAVVGTYLDIAAYYPAVRRPGLYRLVWEPYEGLLASNLLTVVVAPLKRAVLLTDDGPINIDFFYDLAPKHVANFIELIQSGFYNQKTFHRIEPGMFIQGGCPNGDGTGIRPDGRKLDPEFNDTPFVQGTVSMARIESEPSSASCQFIICNTRIPDWDGRYTAFGQIVGSESFTTLGKLMGTSVDPETGAPARKVFIRSARVIDAPLDFYETRGPWSDSARPGFIDQVDISR